MVLITKAKELIQLYGHLKAIDHFETLNNGNKNSDNLAIIEYIRNDYLTAIIPNLTLDDIYNNCDIELYSAYGGAVCWRGNVSDVIEIVKNEERKVNRDYYFALCE
jgi:hypothetical protein